MSEGHKSALNEAIATAAERAETAPRQAQGELFGSLTTVDLAARRDLDRAIAEARLEEQAEDQAALFGEMPSSQPDMLNGEERAPRGPGRPPGSRNWRTQEAAEFHNAPLRVKSPPPNISEIEPLERPRD